VVPFVVDVAAAIAHLVSVEVLGRAVPTVARPVPVMRIFTVVAVILSVVIVDVAVEMLRAMKPWARTDKNPV